jgi:hypothetical protein
MYQAGNFRNGDVGLATLPLLDAVIYNRAVRFVSLAASIVGASS